MFSLLGTETKQQVSGHFILDIRAVSVHSKLSANIKEYKSFDSLLVGRLIGTTFGFYFCLFTSSLVCVCVCVSKKNKTKDRSCIKRMTGRV